MNKLIHNVRSALEITPSHVYWDDWLTDEELDEIEKYFEETSTLVPGTTMKEKINPTWRKSKIQFYRIDQDNQWIFNKLRNLAEHINTEFFQYDLVGFDYLQYTVYDEVGSNYDFHMDMILDNGDTDEFEKLRKLSFTIVLNDVSEFTGGDLEFRDSRDRIIEQKRGRAIAFPSWMLHRVTPIKSGIRKSLVFWVVGPKFK